MTGTYLLSDKLREYAERAVNLDELRPLIVRAADEIDRLHSALKQAADYWSDYHVPCVYEEWDNDCDICPVIEAVRSALESVHRQGN